MTERTKHGAGDGLAVLLFHAAHLHAEVARFDDNANAFGADFFFDGLRDLAGHALLNLQAARKHVDQARDFAEAEDALVGQIGDVGLAEERQQVVLAQAEEFDVFHDDHFVVGDGKRGAVHDGIEILVIAAGEKLQRLFKTLRGLAQTLAVRIFPDERNHFAHQIRDALLREFHLSCRAA